MHRPGTTAVMRDLAGFEAESEPRAVIASTAPAQVAGAIGPATMAGVPSSRTLPCTDDPDLFFAESLERREPWGVWGGELFLRGEIVPRKRPRGRPRKDEVAA